MKNSLSYFFIRLLICLIVIMNFYGCSFINSDDNAIDSIDSNYISYDKGDKNSGILDTSKDGNGFYVTENFVKRYENVFRYYYDTQATYKDIRELEAGINDEIPDIIENGTIDLGNIAIEQLALVMEDYPRQEGEEFVFESEFDEETNRENNPFKILEKLKK